MNNNVLWDNKENKIMWSGIASSDIRKKLNDLNAAMKTAMTNSDPDDSSKNGILKINAYR